MNKGYTSIEQSKKLIELGLLPDTADMAYIEHSTSDNLTPRFDENIPPMNLCGKHISELTVNALPCWSLAALIELMPDIIEEDTVVFGLNIKKNFIEYYNSSMGALYATYHSVNAETTTDAAFEMVCWLLENKFIKTE